MADRPCVIIDELRVDCPDPDKTVCFQIKYGSKLARLELPVVIAGREQEPGTVAYRRDITEFLNALQEALKDPSGIQWPRSR